MAKVLKLLVWHVRLAYLFYKICNLLRMSMGYLEPLVSDKFSHPFPYTFSQHRSRHMYAVRTYFSDSFVLYSCSCYVLLVEFRTSANLTGLHVFALMHIFAQIFCFRTGRDAFSQKNWTYSSLSIFSDSFVVYSFSCRVLLAEASRRIIFCILYDD